jgi:hypothetical protein
MLHEIFFYRLLKTLLHVLIGFDSVNSMILSYEEDKH